MRARDASKARQIKKFTRLHKKQHPITKNEKETVINLSDEKLDDPVYSMLHKGLNFTVTSRSTPIEDMLTGVEKTILSLPVQKAEEARQETVRILKNSSRPSDNLKRTQRAALKTLKDNVKLTILPADKGNVTVVLNTSDYKQKISSLLQDPGYRKITKDPTDSLDRKTTALMKNHQ